MQLNPSIQWKFFYENVKEILSIMYPYTVVHTRSIRKKWITKGIYRLIRERKRLIKMYRLVLLSSTSFLSTTFLYLLIVQNTNTGYSVRGFIPKISIVHIMSTIQSSNPSCITVQLRFVPPMNRQGDYPASALYLTVQILTPALRTSSKVTTPTGAQVRTFARFSCEEDSVHSGNSRYGPLHLWSMSLMGHKVVVMVQCNYGPGHLWVTT